MKAKTTSTIILEMSVEEAQWLQGLMQNPLYGDGSDEEPEMKEMRFKFFHALKEAQPTNPLTN